jgi:hypothetical protein
VRLDLDHLPDEEPVQVLVHVGDANVEDALDLGRGDGQPVRDLLHGGVHRHVLAQPGERGVHR